MYTTRRYSDELVYEEPPSYYRRYGGMARTVDPGVKVYYPGGNYPGSNYRRSYGYPADTEVVMESVPTYDGGYRRVYPATDIETERFTTRRYSGGFRSPPPPMPTVYEYDNPPPAPTYYDRHIGSPLVERYAHLPPRTTHLRTYREPVESARYVRSHHSSYIRPTDYYDEGGVVEFAPLDSVATSTTTSRYGRVRKFSYTGDDTARYYSGRSSVEPIVHDSYIPTGGSYLSRAASAPRIRPDYEPIYSSREYIGGHASDYDASRQPLRSTSSVLSGRRSFTPVETRSYVDESRPFPYESRYETSRYSNLPARPTGVSRYGATGSSSVARPLAESFSEVSHTKRPVVKGAFKALLIGINYVGSGGGRELYGCVNDALCMQKFLELQGWPVDGNTCRVLIDTARDARHIPTRDNIMDGLQWLVDDVRAGDSLFFLFSGHATQVKDLSGDERDGLDEVLITSDHQKIEDDILFDYVRSIPRGALLTCVLDCCHSGTILDLPFVRSAGQSRPLVNEQRAAQMEGRGEVVMFSGCTDSQESGDVSSEYAAGGACTNALLSVLANERNISYARLLERMQDKIFARGLTQVPQMSSSYDINVDKFFGITTTNDSIYPLPIARGDVSDLNPLLRLVNRTIVPMEVRKKGQTIRTRGWFDNLADVAGGAAGDQVMGMVGGFMGGGGGGDDDEDREEGGGGGGGMGGFIGQAMQQFTSPKRGAHGPGAERNEEARQQALGERGGGNRKALLIGINYHGHSPGELRGCINDVNTMCSYLDSQGFPDDGDHRMILVDEGDEAGFPTKDNILAGFEWIVSGAEPGDDLFVHYSGHGAQIRDDESEESDRKDETLVPLDYKSAGMIRDDDVYAALVPPLPQGVRLTCIFDCCHSGSAMDLPYVFTADEMTMEGVNTGVMPEMRSNPAWGFKKMFSAFSSGNYGDVASSLFGMFKKNQASEQDIPGDVQQDLEAEKQTLAEVIMFSGCQDSQTSADVGCVENQFELPDDSGPGGAGGACTSAFLETVYGSEGDISWLELLEQMRAKLSQRGFSQIPQLSSSVPIDLKETFSLIDV